MKYKLLFITLFACGMGWGQLSITSTGTAYTQNFDGLGSSATASLPTGFKVNGNGASPSWTSGTTASTAAAGTTGTGALTGTSGGGTYNFANGVTASSTDRALGFLTSGSYVSPNSIILRITNNTGVTISNLNISFDYEKYRTGTRAWNLTFFHGNTVNPTITETTGDQAYAVDGANAVVNPPTSITKTISLAGLSIANGTDYYLKWTSTGLGGSTNSQGIAIDNFSITAYSPNPSPATLPYTQNFEGVYNEWNLGSNTPNSWLVGSATNNGGSKALYITNNGSANSYTDASSTTAQTIASFQVDLTGIQNAQLSFDWKAMGEENYDYGDVWINTGGNDILLSYMDPQIADSEQYGEFFNSSTFATKTLNLGAYVGGIVTLKFRWRCDNITIANPPFAIDNVSVTAIAPAVVPPTISTYYIGSVTSTSAVVGCNITVQGTNPITERGLCISTTSNPTISDTKIISGSGTGSYDVSVTNLTMSTQYYVRAYAITSAGVYYSNQMDFTTANIGAPTASNASNVTENSFTANWGSVAQATSYRLDVSTNATTFTNYEAFGPFIVFDFENGLQSNPNPNLTNAANTSAYIFAYGGPGNTGLVNYANDSGNGGQVKIVSGWHDGNDTKYWRVNISTLGKYNLKLSSKQRSDSNGPKNWKLQYSIGQDGSENWIDISGGTIVVADNYTSGYLNQISLPSQMENLSIVSLRWVMTSNTSVSNGTVTSAGVSNIDDIIVYGDSPQTLVIGYDNLTVNSTSKIVSGLNPNTNYYYRVRSVASNSTSSNSNTISLSTLNRTTWNSSSWSNNTPTTSLDAVIAGNLTTTADLACKDLTINSGTTLTIGAGKKLTVAGNLINNGSIVFKSDANGTAMFDVFNGTSSGTGTVTVERFIPSGKRAFRLVTPSVTTTTSISNHWQQQTHITGGASGGFDATETNNPSMFTYNNQAVSGTGWTAIPSTTGTNLTAGVGYRLLVRGDRNVNLNSQSNGNMNAAVTLSATGALKTGTVVLNNSSTPAINDQSNPTTAGFSLVGNPYVSPIDWHAVTKNNLEDTYYAWDANLGTGNDRGRYVTYTQSTGTTSILNGSGTTFIGRYIQSGQAFFVKNTTLGTAGTLTFNESNKATTQATVFRSANTALAKMYLTLYDSAEYSIGGYPIDGTVAIFGENFDNTIGQGDVQKLETNGQNVMFLRNAKKLAVEATSLPVNTDELQVVVSNMQANKSYIWKINMSALPASTMPYLVDTFLGTQTALPVNQEQIISFATTDATSSTASNRFKIVFTNTALATDTFTTQIGLYPNPSKGNGFNLQLPSATAVTVKLYNMLGQEISLTANGTYYQANQPLSRGMYHVKVTQGTQTSTLKWIVE